MSRKVLTSLLVAGAAIVVLVVVVVVRREPAPAQRVPNIGSIRDLKPVALPVTAPENQPPKPATPNDDASRHQN